jgi:hypothetical protein
VLGEFLCVGRRSAEPRVAFLRELVNQPQPPPLSSLLRRRGSTSSSRRSGGGSISVGGGEIFSYTLFFCN